MSMHLEMNILVFQVPVTTTQMDGWTMDQFIHPFAKVLPFPLQELDVL